MKISTHQLFIKTTLGFLVFVVCFSSINIKEVSAQSAVVDPTNLVQNTATAVATGASQTSNAATAASTAADAASNAANQVTGLAGYSWSTVGKNALDAAAYTMAQKLLTKLTDNTVAWIRGGFHGSPNFNVDVKEAALEVADDIMGGLVLSLRNLSVCEFTASYKDDLVKSVQQSVKKRPYTFQQKAVCPFNQNYTFKASDFYADFNRGGWEMMGGALSDGGNPYGVQMLVAQEQSTRETTAKATTDQKLNWSNGFTDIIDTTDCNYPPEIFYYPGEGATDEDPDGMSGEEAAAANTKTFSDPAVVAATQKAYCKTTTPGKVVGDQLTKTLGVNMDRIGFADNMNKIVSAFINVAMEGAVRGVFGKGDRSTASGGAIPTGQPTTYQAPTLGVVAANNVTKTTAELTGTLLYTGPASSKLRVWFVVKNADVTIPWAKSFEVLPISPKPAMQSISITALGLPSGSTYTVTAMYTTGGPSLIAPSITSTVINGVVTPQTNPGNGIVGNGSFSFTTLP